MVQPPSQALDRAPSAPAVLQRAGKNALFAAARRLDDLARVSV